MIVALRLTPQKAKKATQFRCFAPLAMKVCLAGDFNDWNPDDHPMNRETDGHWRLDLSLPPGRHEYKFLEDGIWSCGEEGCTDRNTECNKCVPNAFGTMNHVIE